MARFFGPIGFADVTFENGVYKENIIEREYYGDLMRESMNVQSGAKVNDDITISNQISIVSDPYANSNFHSIRYIKYMGAAWKVTGVEVQYPRLILTIGGVYNE